MSSEDGGETEDVRDLVSQSVNGPCTAAGYSVICAHIDEVCGNRSTKDWSRMKDSAVAELSNYPLAR